MVAGGIFGATLLRAGSGPHKPSTAAVVTCSGPQIKLYDNWNGGGVNNGGTQPGFSTAGKQYCLIQIDTYHWNNGRGATPGTVGLKGPGGNLGPWSATGSSGQGGAPNVNWTSRPPAGKAVVLNGSYTCTDSDPATWSSNAASGGQGFCLVTVQASSAAGAGKPAPTPTPAPVSCTGQQVKLFDNWNGGGVGNGGTAPSFSTNGQTYCLVQIDDYHWNNAGGAAPGTIGLVGQGGTLGPWPATGSSGQGGAPNVNWTARPPAGPSVVLNGTYSCKDSDPGSWSSNAQSGGQGFCMVTAQALK